MKKIFLLFLILSSPAFAEISNDSALRVRYLQTKLMVTALSCEDNTIYNNFMNSHLSFIREIVKINERSFPRAKLDRWLTTVANDESLVINPDNATCNNARELSKRLVSFNKSSLLDFSNNLTITKKP